MCIKRHAAKLNTVHAYVNGTNVALVQCLLPNKSTQVYVQFIQVLIELCSERDLTWNPKIILLDFEKAAHQAFLENFPECEIRCCRFHFGQSVLTTLLLLLPADILHLMSLFIN